MYDWANSAFATTILAVVLPIYYSQVAGATLPSKAIATSYWSIGLSVSLFIVAILSPILGTISDVMRGKKRFLSLFAGLGIVGTGLLVLVDTGDWLLASLLFVLGRIGFTGSIVFYDALLPHVATQGRPGPGLNTWLRLGLPGRRAAIGHQRDYDPTPAGHLGVAALVPQRGHLVGDLFNPHSATGARTAGRRRCAGARRVRREGKL